MPLPIHDNPDQTIPVSETFLSVQGEGMLTGMPSVFIRTSGCNLRCAWCDTPYASWKPEGTQRTLRSLVEEASSRAAHVVLTGGEPMLFEQIGPLSRMLKAAGLHITIETAGTIHRPPTEVACDLMSISPKLANSTPRGDPRDPDGQWEARHEARRLNLPALVGLLHQYADHQLKFVVGAPGDLAEIEALLARIRAEGAPVEPSRVLLMPEGVRPPEPERDAWIVAACLERRWRYCRRLHIDLFGNRRGT